MNRDDHGIRWKRKDPTLTPHGLLNGGLWLNDNAIYEPQPLPVRYGRPRNTARRMFIAFCIGSSIGIGILLAVLGILAS